ncbi:tRNA (adenosine(37)-N6)-threonylcarbamoyltransferase complex ATPase subunit type 1 TsaE [Phaeobacter sp. QD34_3]|uniref:tRNA (adenosine(37)-N6)-threonylcarbamoyltransferase complex ATPase subunit type 1 TsaE n=1 Tax=unclassified Phaeobacter TaxID=2621772 RepID=UPI00237F2DD6|nr:MULTISPECIES: tRNA (adenosine(37)-N6)-threonylcarbamoyltransferase complex ATPase subunit type 1 TsaE [unclassified Phaeobacter]MDE4134759.1 tRNA (adenosine(37)-N6)-threonylcarbamoyltransferase complex ATPase subunit type 1 TsaE [Phaeobacter sp. QD34_3]MDE4138377.1 tRNA (adenosine(37)-N6)-threonylcarbamoyltransferase complex ATPase subunit type 1 TsaE [Phaeobacter sp. QD34_24]
MTTSPASCTLHTAEDTAALAKKIAGAVGPGDCLLLEGPIGAGKTHFARHLIQSLQNPPEDVPSPTFTLVQTYDVAAGELWHTDLYRLTSLDEIEELGLITAFDEAITLVEWPDRLAELTPAHALHLTFALDPDDENARQLTLEWGDKKWQPLMERILP